MRTAAKWMILCLALFLAVPATALPQIRNYRETNRTSAFRAGYDAGYRVGLRQGNYDYRFHRRYNYHTRDYNRPDMHFWRESRFKGDYQKGYREGYRAGYDTAFRGYRRDRR